MKELHKLAATTALCGTLTGVGGVTALEAHKASNFYKELTDEQKTMQVDGNAYPGIEDQIYRLEKDRTWTDVITGGGVAAAAAGAGLTLRNGKKLYKKWRDGKNDGGDGPGGGPDEPPEHPPGGGRGATKHADAVIVGTASHTGGNGFGHN